MEINRHGVDGAYEGPGNVNHLVNTLVKHTTILFTLWRRLVNLSRVSDDVEVWPLHCAPFSRNRKK